MPLVENHRVTLTLEVHGVLIGTYGVACTAAVSLVGSVCAFLSFRFFFFWLRLCVYIVQGSTRFVKKTAFLSSPSLPCPLLQGQCLNSFNIYSLSLCLFELLSPAFSVWGLVHEFSHELWRVRPYHPLLPLPAPLPIPHPPYRFTLSFWLDKHSLFLIHIFFFYTCLVEPRL